MKASGGRRGIRCCIKEQRALAVVACIIQSSVGVVNEVAIITVIGGLHGDEIAVVIIGVLEGLFEVAHRSIFALLFGHIAMLIVFGRDLTALTKIISGLVVARALVIHNVICTIFADSFDVQAIDIHGIEIAGRGLDTAIIRDNFRDGQLMGIIIGIGGGVVQILLTITYGVGLFAQFPAVVIIGVLAHDGRIAILIIAFNHVLNDLASQCPQAVAMWSEKNKCYPAEVFAQSTKTAIFNCPKCKHEFETTVTSFVKSIKKSKGNTTGCPICNGTKVVVGYNDLATTCPQVAAMLSKKNADFATKYTMGSNAVASFTCPDCKKEFEAKICKVTNVVYPCPYCRDTKILANHMDLETYLKKNNREDILNCIRPDSPYQASEVSYSSNKTLFLNCPECGNKWVISANYLTAQGISYMCGNCNQTTNFISKPEQYAVRIAMGFARENGVPNAFDEVRHIFGYNNKYGVDFVDNTRKVCMEYNGVYWHKDKKRVDCYKFIKIHNAGYTFIRILEPGLKAFDKKYDIVLPKNYKHGNEYESKIMEDLGYKLISLFEEIYNYKATPEIQKLVDFKEFEKWYDIHRKRISAKATDNAAKKAA